MERTSLLLLDKAAGASGSLNILVRATDADGASILLGGVNDPITVYDRLGGEVGVHKPDTATMGLNPIHLLTSYAFFDYRDGKYEYDQLDKNQFRKVLHSSYVSNDYPVVLDIENDYYDKTVRVLRAPQHARVFMWTPTGTFTYRHDGSQSTVDSFEYEFVDGEGQLRTATASLTIQNEHSSLDTADIVQLSTSLGAGDSPVNCD